MLKPGDIVQINLDPAKGGEKKKTRPCLVLVGSGHPWKLVTVVPVTEYKRSRPETLFVRVPANKSTGLSKNSCVDCFQIRCLSEERVIEKLGCIPEKHFDEVLSKIGLILGIGEEHV